MRLSFSLWFQLLTFSEMTWIMMRLPFGWSLKWCTLPQLAFISGMFWPRCEAMPHGLLKMIELHPNYGLMVLFMAKMWTHNSYIILISGWNVFFSMCFHFFKICAGTKPTVKALYQLQMVTHGSLVGGFKHVFIFHNIWDNPSYWLSYFSRWLKPPTSIINHH